jgi:hypothetical protein
MDLPDPALSCIIHEHLGAKDKLALFQARSPAACLGLCCMCMLALGLAAGVAQHADASAESC